MTAICVLPLQRKRQTCVYIELVLTIIELHCYAKQNRNLCIKHCYPFCNGVKVHVSFMVLLLHKF